MRSILEIEQAVLQLVSHLFVSKLNPMKRYLSALIVLVVSLGNMLAQTGGVRVELSLDQEQFLPAEDLRVNVQISNFSGQTLQLGNSSDWLTFHVEGGNGYVVGKNGNPPVATQFTVQSSKTATTRANIAPYFNIQTPGRYRVVAHVKLPQWQKEITSPGKTFDIISGTKIQTLEFGMPNEAGSTPEVRKFVLQKADYMKERKLYVRITDAYEAQTLKVFPVSRLVSFSEPEAQLDRFNNLHVINQSGQKSFTYSLVNPDGQLLARQTHDFLGASKPHLRIQEDGRIVVKGGVQRVSATDIPPAAEIVNTIPIKDIPPTTDAKSPTP